MREFLRDPAVQFGLKLGIAGLLATYLALALRLDQPTWALFTVFVLMVTPYVGTIVEKSALRICGTIIGAVGGYLLLGWQQQPLIMLPVVALVLACCVAMFGQGLWSYGFFLCGLTLIDVMQAGLGDPQMSWRFALTRMEEVVLGILVAVTVQSVLWPRYAGVEFEKALQHVLGDLRDLLAACVEAPLDSGNADTLEQARRLPLRVAKMRTLITFGANESRAFRLWAPLFEEITEQLNLMSLSVASLSKPSIPSKRPDAEQQSRMKALGRALVDGLHALAAGASSDEAFPRIRNSRGDLEEFLELAKKRGDFDNEGNGHLLSLGRRFQALLELSEAFGAIRERLAMVSSGQSDKVVSRAIRTPTLPSRFWIRLGIKGGLAVAAALLLENWLTRISHTGDKKIAKLAA